MNTATSLGGPFVLLPLELADEWSEAIGGEPEPGSGLYGEVCGVNSLMHTISFHGVQVLRLAEEPGDLLWDPAGSGGLIIQWIGADSMEQLLDFGRKVAERAEWQERLEFDASQAAMWIMDSCGFDDDDQPKIDLQLTPGKYLVEAAYAEDADTMATIFRLTRKDQAGDSPEPSTVGVASSAAAVHSTSRWWRSLFRCGEK